MERDSSFPLLSPLIKQYPLQAGALYNTYADLTLSQQWKDIRIHSLEEAGFAVLFAHKTDEDAIRMILPLPFHSQSLTPSTLRKIFSALSSLTVDKLGKPLISPLSKANDDVISQPAQEQEQEPEREQEQEQEQEERSGLELDKETIYVSIVTSDSSTVYYKLTKGIKKPTDVPDE